MQTKIGSVVFDHNDSFTAEVTISRGDQTVRVAFSALEQIVGESVRHKLIESIQKTPVGSLLQDKLVKKLA